MPPAPTPPAGRIVEVPLGRGLRVSARGAAGGAQPADARGVPDQPEQSDGRLDPATRTSSTIARRGAAGAASSWTRRMPTSPGRRCSATRSSRRCPNVVVGRTFAKAYGLAGIRAGALVGAPDTIATLRRTVPPYTLNVAAGVALPAALADVEYFEWYCRAGARVAGAALAARWTGTASPTGRATATSCWPDSAAAQERDRRVGGARRGHPRSIAGPWLRRMRADHHRRRRAHAAMHRRHWRRFCAARHSQADDDRDLDRAAARSRRQGHLRRQHRHPLLRSHAGAVRAAWRLQPEAGGQGRPRRRSAPHRRGCRHRARRSGVAGARQPQAASTAPATS